MASSAGKRKASSSNTTVKTPKQKSPKKKTSKKPTNLKAALEASKARDVLAWMKDGQLIEVTSEYTLNSCLSVLLESKILAVPVKDTKTEKYTGFVDMVDIVSATVDVEESTGAFEKDEKNEAEDEPSDLEESFIMANLDAKTISDISHRDSFLHLDCEASALEVAKLLVDNHRIGVTEGEKLIGIISQSGFVEYLTEEHCDMYLKSVKKAHIKQLKLPSEVLSIDENEKAIAAFKMMRDKGVSGLAVTKNGGAFSDIISVSDIMVWAEWILNGQPIRFTNLAGLRKPIKEFLIESRKQRSIDEKRKLTVTQDSILEEAISQMQVEHVHRLFQVEDGKATSVVNYNNIIEFLIR